MNLELIIEVLKIILFFPSLITIDRFLINTIILFSIYINSERYEKLTFKKEEINFLKFQYFRFIMKF